MEGKAKNAFWCIRPPGHHAGVYGKVEIDKEELAHIKDENPDYIVTE